MNHEHVRAYSDRLIQLFTHCNCRKEYERVISETLSESPVTAALKQSDEKMTDEVKEKKRFPSFTEFPFFTPPFLYTWLPLKHTHVHTQCDTETASLFSRVHEKQTPQRTKTSQSGPRRRHHRGIIVSMNETSGGKQIEEPSRRHFLASSPDAAASTGNFSGSLTAAGRI